MSKVYLQKNPTAAISPENHSAILRAAETWISGSDISQITGINQPMTNRIIGWLFKHGRLQRKYNPVIARFEYRENKV